MNRYGTEEHARDAAKLKSAARPDDYWYVIESPNPEMPALPYVIDSDGFVRNWERLVAIYHAGAEEETVIYHGEDEDDG